MADVMLRITGERIATPVCGLVRNDIRFVPRSGKYSADSIENHCHCEERSDVAIRIPCIRRMLGGHRPPHTYVR